MNGILITGFGHGGTRLVVDMISNHPDIFLPKNKLNAVNEFTKLHKFYIDSYKVTPFDESVKDYLKYEKFSNIIDEYSNGNSGKNILIKMPFYPTVHIEDYIKKFDNLKIIFINRDKDKILNSFKRRGEHNLYFGNIESRKNQLKKLSVNKRKLYIDKSNEFLLEECFYNNVLEKKKDINVNFIDIDIEKFSFEENEIKRVMSYLELKTNESHIKDMMSMVNKKRLKQDGYIR